MKRAKKCRTWNLCTVYAVHYIKFYKNLLRKLIAFQGLHKCEKKHPSRIHNFIAILPD